MGSACCCLQTGDFEDYMNPSSSVYRNCICLSCFVQNLLSVYMTLFQRGEVHGIPSSIQGAASLTSTASVDNSIADMYHPPPRPLPYDVDPRCVCLHRDGLFSGRGKGLGHVHEESEPLRRDANVDSESMGTRVKLNESYEKGLKEHHSGSSLKFSSAKLSAGFGHFYSSSEDEDVCPTCLEDYCPENPKIVTKCSHHFHLACIYEWMERSESCPVCGKMMAFDETTYLS